ncbi:MAG: flagellar basal body-associated FliL family protein [Nitrospinota bacterium]
MARSASTPGGRSTEIDVADDLFAGGPPPAAEAEAEKPLAQDRVPLVDIPAEKKPKERPPLVEPEKKKPEGKKAAEEPGAEGMGLRGRKEKRPPLLLYYGVPAVGLSLILGLGWTFAFIIRQGLGPRAEAPKPVEQARVLPPREQPPAQPPAPPKDVRETIETLAPQAGPAQPSTAPGGKGDETGAGKVALEDPFFIPLEGGRRNGGDRSPTVFLHLTLTLSLSNEAARREVAGKRSAIREAVFSYFSRLGPQDLASARQREQARAGLTDRLSKEVVQGRVSAVYFEEFFTR